MILKLPRDFEFMINRRTFLKKAGAIVGSSALGAVATKSTYENVSTQSDLYEEKLSPVKIREIDASKRQVIVFTKPLERYTLPAPVEVGGAVAGTGLAVTTDAISNRKVKPKRRTILQGIAGLVAAGAGLFKPVERHLSNVHEYAELTQLRKMIGELKDSGYHVTETTDLKSFKEAVELAKKNRSKDARTLFLLSAHGFNHKGTTLLNFGQLYYFKDLVKAANEIPGHTLIAANSCLLNAQEVVQRANKKNKISLISASGNTGEQLNAAGSPFFS